VAGRWYPTLGWARSPSMELRTARSNASSYARISAGSGGHGRQALGQGFGMNHCGECEPHARQVPRRLSGRLRCLPVPLPSCDAACALCGRVPSLVAPDGAAGALEQAPAGEARWPAVNTRWQCVSAPRRWCRVTPGRRRADLGGPGTADGAGPARGFRLACLEARHDACSSRPPTLAELLSAVHRMSMVWAPGLSLDPPVEFR
jgi:hypothetical protein